VNFASVLQIKEPTTTLTRVCGELCHHTKYSENPGY